MFRLVFIIGTGSFVGGVSRFLASRFIQNHAVLAFPIGTFVVNVLGSFLIGLFYGLSEKGNLLNAEWRMFLTVGFCGGFTTFSTFANEKVALLRDSNFFHLTFYTGLSIFVWFTATYLCNLITKIF